MNAEKREESKENPRAQKYILEVHWKFICKVLDRAEHEILWNGGAHRLYLVTPMASRTHFSRSLQKSLFSSPPL